MPYTRNFGMRSFENVVRAARFRVPAAAAEGGDADNGMLGGLFLIGTAVKIDPDNAGFLTRPDTGEAPGAHCGVVVYEHIQRMGTDPFLTVAQDFEVVPAGQYAQIMRGPGVKVWFKNTDASTSYDGRVTPGRTLVEGLDDLNVGDGLTVGANGTWVAAAGAGTDGADAEPWFIIEQVGDNLVEARFTF